MMDEQRVCKFCNKVIFGDLDAYEKHERKHVRKILFKLEDDVDA